MAKRSPETHDPRFWKLTNMVEETRNIHREVLPNGLIVLTEQMPHIRSVSIGIWVKTGSRHEDAHFNGIYHFLDNIVFNGTQSRSVGDFVRNVTSIGITI